MTHHHEHDHGHLTPRQNRQKHAIILLAVGSVAFLFGFIMLAGGIPYWWALLVGGLVAIAIGVKWFGRK